MTCVIILNYSDLLHKTILKPGARISGLQMQVRVGPLPEKRQLLEGCSGTVISCAAPTVIIFLLVPGDVTLPEAGPLLPAAATTVSPLSQAYSAASMSIRLSVVSSPALAPMEIFRM